MTIGELADLSPSRRIDLLKPGIEGAERRIFSEGAGFWLEQVDTVLIETHGPAALEATQRRGSLAVLAACDVRTRRLPSRL